jgi:hypothetical protein
LRFILRRCGVRLVRLTPQDSRALPAELVTQPSSAHFSAFYEFGRSNAVKLPGSGLGPEKVQWPPRGTPRQLSSAPAKGKEIYLGNGSFSG